MKTITFTLDGVQLESLKKILDSGKVQCEIRKMEAENSCRDVQSKLSMVEMIMDSKIQVIEESQIQRLNELAKKHNIEFENIITECDAFLDVLNALSKAVDNAPLIF